MARLKYEPHYFHSCFFFVDIKKDHSLLTQSSAVQEISFFFFFQAEDGIRDHCVTGVQTCALPIDRKSTRLNSSQAEDGIRDHCVTGVQTCALPIDRKSTRLNSSHTVISYAVFCL